jgi:hypothetical protein
MLLADRWRKLVLIQLRRIFHAADERISKTSDCLAEDAVWSEPLSGISNANEIKLLVVEAMRRLKIGHRQPEATFGIIRRTYIMAGSAGPAGTQK